MTKWCVILIVTVLLGFINPAWSADDSSKVPDARQTVEKFLAAALAGRTKEAAALGEPGKSYDREAKIKEFEGLNVYGKKLTVARVLADEQAALAITEKVVETKKGQEGLLSIRLIKKDKRWLIRDVDFGEKSATKNLQRFQREHPKSKDVEPKKGT
jgi:hypothetical protein